MKIAISSTGPDLDSQVDPRFGRCAYFIILNPDTLEFEAIPNGAGGLGGGAGIQAAQLVANQGAQAVITGNVGPNAAQTLSAAELEDYLGATGPVREAVKLFKEGKLGKAAGATVGAHFGMGGLKSSIGGGTETGRGMGRGMGMQDNYKADQGKISSSPDQEIGALKEEAKALRDQLDSIFSRIKDLEKK